jgi:hypothetical protein
MELNSKASAKETAKGSPSKAEGLSRCLAETVPTACPAPVDVLPPVPQAPDRIEKASPMEQGVTPDPSTTCEIRDFIGSCWWGRMPMGEFLMHSDIAIIESLYPSFDQGLYPGIGRWMKGIRALDADLPVSDYLIAREIRAIGVKMASQPIPEAREVENKAMPKVADDPEGVLGIDKTQIDDYDWGAYLPVLAPGGWVVGVCTCTGEALAGKPGRFFDETDNVFTA